MQCVKGTEGRRQLLGKLTSSTEVFLGTFVAQIHVQWEDLYILSLMLSSYGYEAHPLVHQSKFK